MKKRGGGSGTLTSNVDCYAGRAAIFQRLLCTTNSIAWEHRSSTRVFHTPRPSSLFLLSCTLGTLFFYSGTPL